MRETQGEERTAGRLEEKRQESAELHQGVGWDLWWRWTLATALGELVGFAVPAAAGPLVVWLLAGTEAVFQEVAVLVAVTVAGLVEGAALGFAQWLVLRRHVGVERRPWVVATVLAAGVAYLLGMAPSTLAGLTGISTTAVMAVGIVLGAPLVCSIGFAQWLVLRRHLRGAGWWVLANALAWPGGVAIPFIGMIAVPDESAVAVFVAVGVASGLLMGAVVGAITGLALVWLLRAQSQG